MQEAWDWQETWDWIDWIFWNNWICWMRIISRISRNSRTSSISTSFVNRITHNVNLCFTNNRRNLRNRQTIDFKLPHDVVCACAKRDEPPSRRRPFQFFLDQNNILSTNSLETRPTSARHLFFPCIQWTEKNSCPFVWIRGLKSMG